MKGYEAMRDDPPPTAPPPYTPHLDHHATGGQYQPGNPQPFHSQPTVVHIPQMVQQPINIGQDRECCCCCCSCPFWVCCLIMGLLILVPLISLMIVK